MFLDLASALEGELSEGTAGGAAADLCKEMKGPQSLSGEKQPGQGNWEASRSGATLTLTFQMCENRVHPLLTYELACEDSTAEPRHLLVWTMWLDDWFYENKPRPTELPFQIINTAFSFSTFFLDCKNNICTHKSKKK